MKEMFLCSDRLEKFQSLGENGQAVHISALQLLKTLRLRKFGDVADAMAIPQVNEHGDKIDWYSAITGDVIPWSAANEHERHQALSLLESHQQKIRQLSEEMRQESGADHRLFGQLLEKALQFPDQSHVWLVNGKPVISFWGFINAQHHVRIDPLDCLRPLQPAQLATPVSQKISAAPLLPRVRTGWWWRLPAWLRWLLPLLLLLLLALFLLRACAPAISLPGGSLTTPAIHGNETPDAAPAMSSVTGVPQANSITSGTSASTAVMNNTSSTPSPVPENPAASAIEPPSAEAAPAETTEAASPENSASPEKQPSTGSAATPGETAPNPASANSPQAPLQIPTEALKSGSTAFLNGRWHAGAGIQDQRTGKPLSLSYELKDGKGQVEMTRGDGVTCRGSVNVGIQQGQLAINNQSEAKCSDGSVYRMPEVLCAAGARNIAECKGRYDAQTLFPLSIKQEAGN